MTQFFSEVVFSVIITLSLCIPVHASWLIYHKPEFKGRIIDAETKEPIEEAVVVVEYFTEPLISGPAGGSSSVINVKETLTDKTGEFYFPPYTAFIQPNSTEDNAEFIIYKPGYGNFPNQQITPFGLTPVDEQQFFSKGLGSKGELEMWAKEEKGPQLRMRKVIFGVVEVPRLKTREERLKAIIEPSGHIGSKELPLLYRAINEERKRYGLGDVH